MKKQKLTSLLKDLKNTHIVQPNPDEIEIWMGLLWDLTPLAEVKFPRGYDRLSNEDKIKVIRRIIVDNIPEKTFVDYVREESKKRVKKRQELESKGVRSYVGN